MHAKWTVFCLVIYTCLTNERGAFEFNAHVPELFPQYIFNKYVYGKFEMPDERKEKL